MKAEPQIVLEENKADRPAGQSFLQEVIWFWQKWPAKGLWFAAFGAWLVLFQFLGNSTFGYIDTPSLFRWMHYAYTHATDDEHGMFIPLIVLVLFWVKRRELLAAVESPWWPAAGVLALALGIHILAYIVQQTRISIIAFFLGIYGLLGLVWGRRFMVRSFFPMALFVFAVPVATISATITYPLRVLVAKISTGIGHGILGMAVTRQASQILTPDGAYEVAEACSGIRSLTVLGAITMIYAFLSFTSNWRRLLILLTALPLAVAGNVARVTTVMIIGDVFGKPLAMRIEPYLGLVTFAVAMGCMLLVGSWISERRLSAASESGASALPVSPGPLIPAWNFRAPGLALAIMGAAALLLVQAGARQRLGRPGVKLAAEPTYISDGRIAQTQSVALPSEVLGMSSKPEAVTPLEVNWLPKDTLFGRRTYQSKDGFVAQVSVVMMGTDRTSIHKPEYCLYSQGWVIDKSETAVIPMSRPYPYDLRVMKLTTSNRVQDPKSGQQVPVRGIYLYWFVADQELTPFHGERMWWLARDLIRTGVLQRWAYVTYFAACYPGQEQAAFERLKELLAASVPEFQLAAGPG